MENNNLVLIILVGIPCSGKSTWTQRYISNLKVASGERIILISRDIIRLEMFGKNYKQNKADEEKVTERYYKSLGQAVLFKNATIVLDNCHVKDKYIDKYLTMFRGMHESGNMKIFVKFFDVSLVKALWRNFWRRWNIGKNVPMAVIRKFYTAYKKIDKTKYKHLINKDL